MTNQDTQAEREPERMRETAGTGMPAVDEHSHVWWGQNPIYGDMPELLEFTCNGCNSFNWWRPAHYHEPDTTAAQLKTPEFDLGPAEVTWTPIKDKKDERIAELESQLAETYSLLEDAEARAQHAEGLWAIHPIVERKAALCDEIAARLRMHRAGSATPDPCPLITQFEADWLPMYDALHNPSQEEI